MLKIFFGKHPDEIYNTEVYYANQYDKNWVMDPFAKKVIADIDSSIVVAPDMIQNDVFGTFGSTELSAGVKTLLLIQNQPQRRKPANSKRRICVYRRRFRRWQEHLPQAHHA